MDLGTDNIYQVGTVRFWKSQNDQAWQPGILAQNTLKKYDIKSVFTIRMFG